MAAADRAPSPEDVSAAVLEWLRARFGGEVIEATAPSRIGGGFDFWIYGLAFSGTALPPEWTTPLVARIPPDPKRFPALKAEGMLQDWTCERGYPATSTRALLEPGELLPQPVQLAERLPGQTMMATMLASPWRTPALIGRLAELHSRLHALPPPDPLVSGVPSVIDKRLRRVHTVAERFPGSAVAAGLEHVQRFLPALEVADPVICHGDFHPLNLLVEGDGVWVIDWTDAGIGDRHADVARTTWLFHFAPLVATSQWDRVVLRAAAPLLARRYLTLYRRYARVDPARLRLWKPLHLLHALAVFTASDAEDPSRSRMASWAEKQFSLSMADVPVGTI